jgi:hypothetical protein
MMLFMITVASAVLLVTLTNRNRSVSSCSRPLDEMEVAAAKLKAATKKVDNSAAAVAAALKPLLVA